MRCSTCSGGAAPRCTGRRRRYRSPHAHLEQAELFERAVTESRGSRGWAAGRLRGAMPMPTAVRDDAVREVAAFCERRVRVDLRGELRLEHSVRGSGITIVE